MTYSRGQSVVVPRPRVDWRQFALSAALVSALILPAEAQTPAPTNATSATPAPAAPLPPAPNALPETQRPANGNAKHGAPTVWPTNFAMQARYLRGGKSNIVQSYFDNGNIRVEYEEEGIPRIIIVRADKARQYFLFPTRKQYVEMPIEQESWSQYNPELALAGYRWEKIGEVMEGETPAFHYKAYLQTPNGLRSTDAYIERDTRRLVRIDLGPDGMNEYGNYKIGSQKPELFEIPADYQPASTRLNQ